MRCFGCGARVQLAAGERVGFRDSCDACHADLHVCRNCAHHDPGAHNECREPGSEMVSDRERMNRCEWFRPAGDETPGPGTGSRDASRKALDALFKK